jgi:succinate dehydrogenase / fumarate reductase cytochrome b subunit
MDNNKPLSPHIQIYSWNISSLISISHRITGVINIVALTIICFWIVSFLFGNSIYVIVQNILNSFFGKFLVIGITWSFSFQILSEIRHLFWDLGYGFELKTSNISGAIVIFGSFIMTVLIYILGRQLI